MKNQHKSIKMILAKDLTLIITIFAIFSLISTAPLSSIKNNKFSELGENNKDIVYSTGLAPKVADKNQEIPTVSLPLGEVMWGYIVNSSVYNEGTCCFDVDDPGTLEFLHDTESDDFLSGGTGFNGKWYACENSTGALWEIDIDTGDMTSIGGGGVGLNGLSLDFTTTTFYGASGSALYMVDIENGDQELIGNFGNDVNTMIGIACDKLGVCYGWDLGDKLWIIDTATGEATEVGPLGVDINYAQDGDFCHETDTLFLTTYTVSPNIGSYLYTCDTETGDCELIGQFEGNSQITASVASFGWPPPPSDIGIKDIISPMNGDAVDPIYPQVMVKNYGNHSEVTDVQFDIMKFETGPILLEEYFDTWPPEGWSNYGYETSSTNYAGGEAPEAYYGYYSGHNYSNGYIMTPEINTSSYEKINVKFKLLGEFSSSYSPYLYLQYRKSASSPWRDVSPWNNPVSGDLGSEPFEIGCYGWGEDLGNEFQVRWYFGSYYYYLLYGSGIYIDNVIIEGCSGNLDYNEVIEEVEIPLAELVEVEFPGWTPPEWHNESYQNTWIEYPITAYTSLKDNNNNNNKKNKLLSLYYPFLHDVGALNFEGPESGPAQTFPVSTTIKNFGQYDECCFKTYVEISEIDLNNSDIFLEEDFNPYTEFPPNGWTRTSTKWDGSNSNYCGGGDNAEARFYYSPAETGMFRLYTPALDTSGYGAISIEFTNYVNHYTTPYTLRVETSKDAVSWTSVWDISPTGTMGPKDVQIFTGDNVGGDTYVSWTFDGYSWNINYWYLDDIVIKGIQTKEPEYQDEVCVEGIEPGEEILFEFDDWTPEFLQYEISDNKKYVLKAWTDLNDPIDENSENDILTKSIILDFFHDVGVKEIISPSQTYSNIYGNWWYAVDCSSNYFVRWNPWTGESEYIAPTGMDYFPQGGTFVEDEWWVCDTVGNIWIVDTENGEKTFVGNCGTGSLVGIAYHEKSETLYGMSTSEFYEIDMDTGDASLIGSLGTGTLMISCDCDRNGTMYSYDLGFGTANLYKINLETGHATVIGPTGVQLNYGQDMAYDYDNGTMYACVFNYASWQGELHSINLETGAFTYIATLAGGGQYTCFAISYYGLGLNPDVYLTQGVQDIGVLVKNFGTFSEHDMTCYAEIQEFITNCTNGTTVYEDMIEGIDLEEPLGGTQTQEFDDFDFAMEGLYGLFVTLEDDNDDNLKNNELIWGIGVDNTPPVSSHELDPAVPNGLEGYYVDDITVTLTAYDPTLGCKVAGSQVKEIRYTINGDQGLITGGIGTFDITEDGNDIEIEYWAIDNVGNVEDKNSFTIDMDQRLPDISEVEWQAKKQCVYWFIKYICEATDETSGMDKVEMYLNNGLVETIEGPGPKYEFEIQWSPVLKNCLFKFLHYDKAGWATEDIVWGGDIVAYPYMNLKKSSQNIQGKSNKLIIN